MSGIRSLAIVGGCLLLSMAGFACGSDRSPRDAAPPVTSRDTQDTLTNIVSNEDIRRTKPGTPERTILSWAQAVQFGDVRAVRAAYTERVRESVPIARLHAATKQIASLLGRPEIVSPMVQGSIATVRVALISYDSKGKRSVQPTTFRLRQENRRWLLDDASLLLESAAALRRSTR